MSYLAATCPFCGSRSKRFALPNGIITEYFVCESCNKVFTLSQSLIGEIARKMFNAKSDIIPSSRILLSEKEARLKERL